MLRFLATVGFLAMMTSTALAQSPAPPQSAPPPNDPPPATTPPTPSAQPPLAGPAVERPTDRPSLVILDFAGHVKRYDEPIEQAAAALLALDEATSARVREILDRRLAT